MALEGIRGNTLGTYLYRPRASCCPVMSRYSGTSRRYHPIPHSLLCIMLLLCSITGEGPQLNRCFTPTTWRWYPREMPILFCPLAWHKYHNSFRWMGSIQTCAELGKCHCPRNREPFSAFRGSIDGCPHSKYWVLLESSQAHDITTRWLLILMNSCGRNATAKQYFNTSWETLVSNTPFRTLIFLHGMYSS